MNANDILRLVRRAQQEPDRLDRERLMRRAREKDGFLLGGRGIPGIAQALGKFLHGDVHAFEAESYSYL